MMKYKKKITTIFSLVIAIFSSSAVSAQIDSSKIVHSFFLIGDAGEPIISDSKIGHALRYQVERHQRSSTVILLGDNIYPAGLSEPGSLFYDREEKILKAQVDWVDDLDVNAVFIPGNHDWQQWGPKGLERVRRQQQWIDSLDDERISFYPKEGCPGPVEIELNSRLVLVIIDTQWFLHRFEKPGEESECDFRTKEDVFSALSEILQRSNGKRVILAGHHPVLTYGSHGGVFSWKDHIFPFHEIIHNFYLPLPIIGSLLPLYRKWFGHIQDNAHPNYKAMASALHHVLKQHPGSIYIAGHEHALQHSVKDSVHYVVSGSSTKESYVKKKGYARFVSDDHGFARLDILDNGECNLYFFKSSSENPDGRELYRTSFSFSQSAIQK